MQNLGQLFRGGSVNLKQAPYIIGPVAKRMAELEGPRLGGFYSTVIVNWLAGLPFVQIKSESKFDQRLEDLIAVVYSRVQFLLPWGLYATDALIETEAKKRNLNYENDVLKLAYLSDCGVPNFDALRLVNSDIERVDATRLSIAYKHSRKIHEGLDLFGWLFSLKQEALEEIVTGEDKRKVAHGFYADIDKLRGSSRQ